MERMRRLVAVFGFVAAAAVLFRGTTALSQGSGSLKPPADNGKASVQGYTRTNRKTGQPEQVKPHVRKPPQPKPVQVQPYTRNGQPVSGHQRRPPASPATGQGGSKRQSRVPHSGAAQQWIA